MGRFDLTVSVLTTVLTCGQKNLIEVGKNFNPINILFSKLIMADILKSVCLLIVINVSIIN